jgi:hypothetical protein
MKGCLLVGDLQKVGIELHKVKGSLGLRGVLGV